MPRRPNVAPDRELPKMILDARDGRWCGGSAMVGRRTYRSCDQVMIISESAITCPVCGASKVETMPTDACQFFYECTKCGATLHPKAGDCCIFCSYGSVPC